MTVCIAAVCESVGPTPKIVVCSDWRGSSPLGRSDFHFKMRPLPRRWECLTSGPESEIIALHRILRRRFQAAPIIDEATLGPVIRDAFLERKQEKSHEYVAGRHAMSLDDFFNKGKDRLPSDIFRETHININQMTIKCDLIFAGFLNAKDAFICQTAEQGFISPRDNFCTVGEGAFLAGSALYARQQNEARNLLDTLYAVYEAKKYAERVPSVSEQTSLAVMTHDSFKFISDSTLNELGGLYMNLGPRPLADQVEKALTGKSLF